MLYVCLKTVNRIHIDLNSQTRLVRYCHPPLFHIPGLGNQILSKRVTGHIVFKYGFGREQ